MISNHFIENNFPKGIVTLVGARPAIGKSAFAISMAINLARRNQKFIYFSLEMDKERVIDRNWRKLRNFMVLIYKGLQIITAMITYVKGMELFCMVDDFCKFFYAMMTKYMLKPATKRKYHRDSTMSKVELCLS